MKNTDTKNSSKRKKRSLIITKDDENDDANGTSDDNSSSSSSSIVDDSKKGNKKRKNTDNTTIRTSNDDKIIAGNNSTTHGNSTVKEFIEYGGTKYKSNEEKSNEVERTLFVNGISKLASLSMVKKYFELVALKTGGTPMEDVRIAIYNDTGKLRGYAHVVLHTIEQAKRIIQDYNDTKFNGQPIYYEVAKKPIKSDSELIKTTVVTTDGIDKEASERIQINNLSFAATEIDIQNALEQYTNRIVDIRIAKQTNGREIGQSKGYAYVTFESIQDAKVFMAKAAAASNTQITTILDRPCRFDYDYTIQASNISNSSLTSTPARQAIASPLSSTRGRSLSASSSRSRRRKSTSGSPIKVPTTPSTESPTKNVQPFNLKY